MTLQHVLVYDICLLEILKFVNIVNIEVLYQRSIYFYIFLYNFSLYFPPTKMVAVSYVYVTWHSDPTDTEEKNNFSLIENTQINKKYFNLIDTIMFYRYNI